jgi:hypothetical protein
MPAGSEAGSRVGLASFHTGGTYRQFNGTKMEHYFKNVRIRSLASAH